MTFSFDVCSWMTVRRFTAQCLPPLRDETNSTQATAALRNFKPVDVADGAIAHVLGTGTRVSRGLPGLCSPPAALSAALPARFF
jgi:hypothetical protein